MKLLVLFLSFSLAYAKNCGSINIDGVGEIYLVSGNCGAIQIHDNGWTANGGYGLSFAKEASDSFYPEMYWATPLNDKHFSYTIDVSRVDCHCNAAAYFSNVHTNRNPGEWGEYYCDANHVNGVWCPEYDTWEGNKYTMGVALHTCSGSGANGNWDYCDGAGCGTNAFYANSNLMCPEDRCTINTNRPFTVSHHQTSSFVNAWFEQEGRTASFNACNDGGYVSQMAQQSFDGTVFRASMWGGPDIDMNWLDGMTGCQGSCNLASQSVTFSNFQLCLTQFVNCDIVGRLSIKGIEHDLFVGTSDPKFIEMEDHGFTLHGGGNLSLFRAPIQNYSLDQAWPVPLGQKHFSYTIDISGVGCHCNAAAYFVVAQNNPFPGKDGSHYCDAKGGNQVFCPEYDAWEGNKYTMDVNCRPCWGSDNGTWTDCVNGFGCHQNAYYANTTMMCPSEKCTINTNKPFRVSHFQSSEEVTVSFEQDKRQAQFVICNVEGFLITMDQEGFTPGMVFFASIFGGPGYDSSWLDGMTGCKGDPYCNLAESSVSFSHFELD